MSETTYWGVLCRTCQELVAFDRSPFPSFGPRAASLTPGAIRCSQGHNHIYFPHDFQFHQWHLRVGDAVMEQNRAAYAAINPSGSITPSSTLGIKQTIPPKTEPAAVPPPKTGENIELHPNLPPDLRREDAQMAARHRWAEWASKKIS